MAMFFDPSREQPILRELDEAERRSYLDSVPSVSGPEGEGRADCARDIEKLVPIWGQLSFWGKGGLDA